MFLFIWGKLVAIKKKYPLVMCWKVALVATKEKETRELSLVATYAVWC